MRYFLENFENVHNGDWPFGQFPAWEWYKATGTHVGTDFKVPVGTSVFAPADGEMFKVEYNRYKGNVGVYIFRHGGVEWGLELCHLKELPQKGHFKEGEVIAYSGMTGEKVDGAHLHAVLHRDAMVTKHYQQLQSREAFLRLNKEGAIVDCYEWFCKNIKGEDGEKKEKSMEAPTEPEKKARAATHTQSTPKKLVVVLIVFIILFVIIGYLTNWFGLL